MADDTAPQTQQPAQAETSKKRCIKCGKIIRPDQQYTHQGQVYCCDKCCLIKTTPGVCEFC